MSEIFLQFVVPAVCILGVGVIVCATVLSKAKPKGWADELPHIKIDMTATRKESNASDGDTCPACGWRCYGGSWSPDKCSNPRCGRIKMPGEGRYVRYS